MATSSQDDTFDSFDRLSSALTKPDVPRLRPVDAGTNDPFHHGPLVIVEGPRESVGQRPDGNAPIMEAGNLGPEQV